MKCGHILTVNFLNSITFYQWLQSSIVVSFSGWVSLLHEGTNLNEDTFARGETFARRHFTQDNFCTRGQFCTVSLLHECLFSTKEQFCTTSFLHEQLLLHEGTLLHGDILAKRHFCTALFFT